MYEHVQNRPVYQYMQIYYLYGAPSIIKINHPRTYLHTMSSSGSATVGRNLLK